MRWTYLVTRAGNITGPIQYPCEDVTDLPKMRFILNTNTYIGKLTLEEIITKYAEYLRPPKFDVPLTNIEKMALTSTSSPSYFA